MLPPPSELFGEMFAVVQEAGLFPDSKTFADASPRRDPADIMSDWQREAPNGREDILAFVLANFALPEVRSETIPPTPQLADHLVALWPLLTRDPEVACAGSSLLSLPSRYVVPGGRFRELYYWDSYFTMLGLARSGQQDLVEDMIANFGSLLDRFGRIPNGTRTYYLSRSHPPVFYLIASLSQDDSVNGRRQRLEWMVAEHRFWMTGADALEPGCEHRRVVRLSDGTLLNRYWDDRASPRDESWREDVMLAGSATWRPSEDLWRDVRAAAESGWDFSSRWLGDRQSLESIRTTRILPVDLNALLHGLEMAISDEALAVGEVALARCFAVHAEERKTAINVFLWNEEKGFYADYDLDRVSASEQATAAMAFPLFSGAASLARAKRSTEALAAMLSKGGLLTTETTTSQQWDSPNGWAPLQWIGVKGLERYGHSELAAKIGESWLSEIERHYRSTGQMLEKYDVKNGGAGGGGEYALETGFGWTNGVTLEFQHLFSGPR